MCHPHTYNGGECGLINGVLITHNKNSKGPNLGICGIPYLICYPVKAILNGLL